MGKVENIGTSTVSFPTNEEWFMVPREGNLGRPQLFLTFLSAGLAPKSKEITQRSFPSPQSQLQGLGSNIFQG